MDPAAKGQDLLLQILARPEWRDRPVELNLFGAGRYELALRRLAAMLQLNQVHFHGHVAALRRSGSKTICLFFPLVTRVCLLTC